MTEGVFMYGGASCIESVKSKGQDAVTKTEKIFHDATLTS